MKNTKLACLVFTFALLLFTFIGCQAVTTTKDQPKMAANNEQSINSVTDVSDATNSDISSDVNSTVNNSSSVTSKTDSTSNQPSSASSVTPSKTDTSQVSSTITSSKDNTLIEYNNEVAKSHKALDPLINQAKSEMDNFIQKYSWYRFSEGNSPRTQKIHYKDNPNEQEYYNKLINASTIDSDYENYTGAKSNYYGFTDQLNKGLQYLKEKYHQ